MADIDRRRFGPGADQRGEPKATVGRDPGFAVRRIVVGAGDAGKQAFDERGRYRAIGGRVSVQPTGERQRLRLSLQHLGVVQQLHSVADLQVAVGRDPGVEQAGGFKRGLEAGALSGRDLFAKIHQFQSGAPSRAPPALASRVCGCGGVASTPASRRLRSSSRVVALRLQRLALAVERHVTLRQTLAGVLLRRLQAMSRRIVAIQPNNPVGEGRERCAAVVGADLQLLQAGEVALPCLKSGCWPS